MVRLRPIALTLIIFLPFASFWVDQSSATTDKSIGLAPNSPKIRRVSAKSSMSVATRPGNVLLKSKQSNAAQTKPDTNSSQGAAQSLTIEKKSVASLPSSSGEKLYPSYRKTNPDLILSLPQAIQIALARNLTMADSRLAVEEREYQRREAYSDFFPTMTVQYGATWDRYWNPFYFLGLYGNNNSTYSYFQQQVRLSGAYQAYHEKNGKYPFWGPPNALNQQPGAPNGLYPYRIDPYRMFVGSITMTQPIFTGGQVVNNYKYARLGKENSGLQFELNRQDLILNVNQAYYQMMQAQKLLQVSNAAIRALEALVNQTKEFYKAGTVPKVDVLSTEGQLAQARIQRTQAIADIARSQATLNYLLRNPQETPIQIIEDMSYAPSQYKLTEAYAIAAINRLEIRQANISVDQALTLIKSAKADALPNINLSLTGARYNDDWNVIDPEAFNDWRIQGLLTWTFDLFRKRSTVAERRTTEARNFVQRELQVETVMDEVKQAYEDMERNYKTIGDNKASVEFQTENFRINQERYREQVATYVEVLDAQRQLQLAQGNYYISICGFKISQATLERKMGTLR